MNWKIKKKMSLLLSAVLIMGTVLACLVGDAREVNATGSGTAENPYIITTAAELNNVRNNLSGYYKLGNDIDLSSFSNWKPIGDQSYPFSGGFDGDGHTITGLTITLSSNYAGLFGNVSTLTGHIRNVYLTDVNINLPNSYYVGSLVGNIKYGTVENSSASGYVKGDSNVGGLIGRVEYSATVNGNITDVTVEGKSYLGGLIGRHDGSNSTIANNSASGSVTGSGSSLGGLVGYIGSGSNISNSYAIGDVTGTDPNGNSNYLGGLVGSTNSQLIEYSYATGDVTSPGGSILGGLAGAMAGTLKNSYATGDIHIEGEGQWGFKNAGGLVGRFDSGKIDDSYASGNVSGNTANTLFGGLVGSLNSQASIKNSYSVGQVLGSAGGLNGGLVGSGGTVTNSYYIDTAWSSSNGKGIAKTAEELKSVTTFEEWDFNNTWSIEEGVDYPKLQPYVLPTYTIEALDDQTLTELTEGYVSGSQESREITITRTGTGDLENVSAVLSEGDTDDFEIEGLNVTTLNDGTPSTTFTVMAKDNLPKGTYTATVSITANHMDTVTFNVEQVVSQKVVLKGDANGDGQVTPADSLMITQYLNGKITLTDDQKNALDMNDDGKLDSDDVKLIMEIYLGGLRK